MNGRGDDAAANFESCPGGLPGKCFVPPQSARKKHPCRDCSFCQWCSDDRCTVCLTRQRAGEGPLPPGQ